MKTSRFYVIAGIIGAAALSRIVPHPPNFAPMNAMALFAGAYLADKKISAIIMPLIAMLLSDTLLQMLTGWGFHADMWIVYGAIACITMLGFRLQTQGVNEQEQRNQLSATKLITFSVLASIFFFVVTNAVPFALHGMYGMYAHTWDGFVACFVAAIPFFQNALLGDLVFTAVLFGGFELAQRTIPSIRTEMTA
ncbi:MAG: hypothetical protein EAZ92_06955 [Candidatus Kapaibacterium sp.]|nr:MAG: hypothetical protein EAZ92_06955 [Candidatus Kapabacteria bacterium]